MKFLRLALATVPLFAGLAALHAQEGQGGQQDEIITDFGIDEYIYQPKYTLRIGARQLSGTKSSFAGRGIVKSTVPLADISTPNLTRYYHDGSVFADTRTIIDTDGITTPITPDGFTNSWSFNFDGQLAPDGNLAFHGYAADIADPGQRQKNANSSYGVEVVVSRDMGKLGKTQKFAWTLFAGLSLNEINSSRTEDLASKITTTTDYYTLNGQLPPTAPYLGPTSGATSIVNPDGSVSTVTIDTTTLLGSKPLGRVVTVTDGIVFNRWKVKGAFFTFRAGPSLSYSITEKLRATVSAGAALVFVGSTYTVNQIYTPDVGADVVSTVDDSTEKLLPGYYADATIEYDFTERAGAYAGALYQSTGNYSQTAYGPDASYTTNVDLASLQGFRLGMNIRF